MAGYAARGIVVAQRQMSEREVTVFTMEKVGSSTVKYALEQVGFLVGRGYLANQHEINIDVPIITMVRDPVTRAISALFEKNTPVKADTLFQELNISGTFFKEGIEELLAIDVFDEPFPKQRGWHVYDGTLLLIRTEDLTLKLPEAIRAFLGVDIESAHRAKGEERFGLTYQRVINEMRLEAQALDLYYGLPFTKHFYTPEEIQTFKDRWS